MIVQMGLCVCVRMYFSIPLESVIRAKGQHGDKPVSNEKRKEGIVSGEGKRGPEEREGRGHN